MSEDEKDITDLVAGEAKKPPKRTGYKPTWDASRGRAVPKSYPRSPTNPVSGEGPSKYFPPIESEREELFPDEGDDCMEHEFKWGVIHQGRKVVGSIARCENCDLVLSGAEVEALLKTALVMDAETLDWLEDQMVNVIGETIEVMQLRELAHWRRQAEQIRQEEEDSHKWER